MKNSDAIIIGAGPAGLACAATMSALRLNATVLEKAGAVGSVWRRHYDRLHLHTDRGHSGLSGMDMPRAHHSIRASSTSFVCRRPEKQARPPLGELTEAAWNISPRLGSRCDVGARETAGSCAWADPLPDPPSCKPCKGRGIYF
jgi:phytoene dehydrogenase-like protein